MKSLWKNDASVISPWWTHFWNKVLQSIPWLEPKSSPPPYNFRKFMFLYFDRLRFVTNDQRIPPVNESEVNRSRTGVEYKLLLPWGSYSSFYDTKYQIDYMLMLNGISAQFCRNITQSVCCQCCVSVIFWFPLRMKTLVHSWRVMTCQVNIDWSGNIVTCW